MDFTGAPKLAFASSRFILGPWILACVAVAALYTGNLVAYLSVTELTMPFETLDEMAAQTYYKYGYSGGDVTRVLLEVM